MIIKRKKTNVVKIGRVEIGGRNPIAIQSMAKVPTSDVKAVVSQINSLERIGCSIVRVAVKEEKDARAIKHIKDAIRIPLVADIHFDWKLAILAIEAGADKIRLNPGNIYKINEIKRIVSAARDYSIPIRVGLNSGSIPKAFRYSQRLSHTQKMLKAAFDYINVLEDLKFTNIVVSLKCSGVLETIEVYEKFSRSCEYPLHIGLTASGFIDAGRIKSAICLGVLLEQGIGDTIRVSLTGSPEEEVMVARYILSGLGLGSFGPEIISCPTCGRCEVDLSKIVNELQHKLLTLDSKLLTPSAKLAIMGCVVNGPGEAKEADLAVAFGKGSGMLYKNSKPLKKVSAIKAVDELIKEWKKTCKKI